MFDFILDKEDKRQGLTRDANGPLVDLQTAQGYVEGNINPVSETDRRVVKRADDSVARVMQKVNAFYETTWKDYRTMMEKVSLSVFKDYKPLVKQ